MLGPQSRYRIYGGFVNYKNSLRDQLWPVDQSAAISMLENKMRYHFQVPGAVAVPMARVGIYLAVKNLIRPGQEVLMSPYTIADVVNVVIAAGGRPRFVDVESRTGNMDPEYLKKRIRHDCGAILVTHLHGITAAIEDIAMIAREAGLPLIEDNAQALGARTAYGFTGALSEVGVMSFGTYKNINSWFGGMILTRDRALAAKIQNEISAWPEFSRERLNAKIHQAAVIDLLGWKPLFSPLISRIFRHGFLNDIQSINRMTAIELDTSRHDQLPEWYKTRLTALQAHRVLEQWPSLSAQTDARIHKATIYDESIPDGGGLLKPPAPEGQRHVYTYYPLRVEKRQSLLKWLMYFRRDVAAQHLKNCASLESFREFAADCPVAEQVARSVILLPTYPSYRTEQVLTNAAVVRWFHEQGSPDFQLHSRPRLKEFARTQALDQR